MLRVTEIISDVLGNRFGAINPIVLDNACERGIAVHKTLTLYDKDDLGECHVTVEPYLDAWVEFKKMYKPEFLLIEQRLTDNVLRFTGQPDRIAVMQKKKWVIDFKTGQKSPEQALQTAAYEYLYLSENPGSYGMRRMCVFLNGKDFNVVEYSDPSDKNIFLNMLSIAKWKKNHNLGG